VFKKFQLQKYVFFANCASYAALKKCADSKKWVDLNLKDVHRVVLCALLEKVRRLQKDYQLELGKSANLKSKRVRQLEKVR